MRQTERLPVQGIVRNDLKCVFEKCDMEKAYEVCHKLYMSKGHVKPHGLFYAKARLWKHLLSQHAGRAANK